MASLYSHAPHNSPRCSPLERSLRQLNRFRFVLHGVSVHTRQPTVDIQNALSFYVPVSDRHYVQRAQRLGKSSSYIITCSSTHFRRSALAAKEKLRAERVTIDVALTPLQCALRKAQRPEFFRLKAAGLSPEWHYERLYVKTAAGLQPPPPQAPASAAAPSAQQQPPCATPPAAQEHETSTPSSATAGGQADADPLATAAADCSACRPAAPAPARAISTVSPAVSSAQQSVVQLPRVPSKAAGTSSAAAPDGAAAPGAAAGAGTLPTAAPDSEEQSDSFEYSAGSDDDGMSSTMELDPDDPFMMGDWLDSPQTGSRSDAQRELPASFGIIQDLIALYESRSAARQPQQAAAAAAAAGPSLSPGASSSTCSRYDSPAAAQSVAFKKGFLLRDNNKRAKPRGTSVELSPGGTSVGVPPS